MKISHHLDEATVLSFAAGVLAPAIAVAASAHLNMCSSCRDRLDAAEAAGGALLESMDQQPLSQHCINNVLELIEADGRSGHGKVEASVPEHVHIAASDVLPKPVASLIGTPLEDIHWKRAGRGISTHQIDIGDDTGSKLFLMKIEAGKTLPEHSHGGTELTLVLSGAYTDKCGRFARGDVADLSEDVEHQPVVGDDEDCICLVATEQPTRFKGLIPRLLQPLVGI